MRIRLKVNLILNLMILTALMIHGSRATAGEKVYFSAADGAKFWCDRDDLEYHWDESGKLAEICNPMSDEEADRGTTEAKPFELNLNGRLFREYVLDLLRDGEVSFKDKSDAENTLRICEKFGLPKAEDFICKLLKRKPKREIPQTKIDLTGTHVSNTQFQSGDCAEGYVRVPGNDSYGTPGNGEDFCVMKYAAFVGADGKAISQQGTQPKVNINRANAAAACRANSENYHLITNAEWMTIARDIELTPENWSGGSVGTGVLSRGNSNSTAALASASDEDPHHGTGATDWSYKRTHTLSNGEVIWDMAGNVWQWVADPLTSNGNGGQEYTEMQSTDVNRALFGPRGPYDRITHSTGRLYHGTAGAVLRGGAWYHGTVAGVFAAHLHNSASDANSSTGFRCAATLGAR